MYNELLAWTLSSNDPSFKSEHFLLQDQCLFMGFKPSTYIHSPRGDLTSVVAVSGNVRVSFHSPTRSPRVSHNPVILFSLLFRSIANNNLGIDLKLIDRYKEYWSAFFTKA